MQMTLAINRAKSNEPSHSQKRAQKGKFYGNGKRQTANQQQKCYCRRANARRVNIRRHR